MATSKIDICNSALSKIGVEKIASFAQTSKASVLCNLQYDKIRRKVLREHLWNFAVKRASLAKLVAVPLFGYGAAFQLPADNLLPIEVDIDDDWEEEGQTILINSSTCQLKYIYDVTDVSLFDVVFEEVLAYMLAAELAYPLKQSTGLSESMAVKADLALRNGRFYDAKIGRTSKTRKLQADVWLDARVTGLDAD